MFRKWTSKDVWTDVNDMNRGSCLSDESAHIKRELVAFVMDPVRMSVVNGDQAGFFLGMVRLMLRGYKLGTNREFIFLTISCDDRASRIGSVLRSKLNRWGWDNVPEGNRDVWRHYIAEKSHG